MELTNMLLEDQNALINLVIVMLAVNAGITTVLTFFVAKGSK